MGKNSLDGMRKGDLKIKLNMKNKIPVKIKFLLEF